MYPKGQTPIVSIVHSIVSIVVRKNGCLCQRTLFSGLVFPCDFRGLAENRLCTFGMMLHCFLKLVPV